MVLTVVNLHSLNYQLEVNVNKVVLNFLLTLPRGVQVSQSEFQQSREMSNQDKSYFPHFATKLLHEGQEPEKWNSRAVIPPISLATTFKQDSPGVHRGYEYSRSGNPTRECFEQCVASMEGGKYGLAFSSGLGASTTMITYLEAGAHVICMDDVYGGTNRLFSKVLSKHGINFDFIDMRDLALVEKHIKPGVTKLLWIETPTNPTMKIVDIEAVAAIAHKYEDITVLVDNTFMSPYFQRPLIWGADVVLHSVTKYINGHSDCVMGVMVMNDEKLYEKLKYLQNAAGIVPSPFDCYLANRGAKTLHVRMERHQQNAIAIAKFLEKHPMVESITYPGLESHPQYKLIQKQCRGYSGMISFTIKGNLETAKAFLKAVKIFYLAESLGGFESLLEHPAIMTHASVEPEDRKKLGISDTFIRLSVGLEDVEDLIEDLDNALKAAQNV
ncbi:cystathionine gamma-lyase-like [Hydractinia symbiolongicarpus]|uniref:cystathionine gamma-lyase-like n=1 Tax=Hydractinia symbiolongicarpus TaxID=13093 RepID=UPI00254FE2C8|nr:cystathionine gamma-lyase-like [Hydractinia symbiolongicarpus]